uniref:Phosphoprotein n=1 Tax=Gaboon viper virus 1 TaxID=1889242 RepID=UPI002249A2E8|nr:Chain A, Phosphoprotein [Gaboon viper virus 1]8B8D_B Chain B, Phosphoprotein [Gaboon viper virus 1]8B8D_C Chain C, Phosphoprotein [Gaboon viper virus 1]8B8D_D Chain D, Phosphoprotein [Gaboon viper virus 1]
GAMGRETLSSEELVKQLMEEIKTATEDRKIDQEVLQMRLSHLEQRMVEDLESLSTLQSELLEKIELLDYSSSIKQIGENLKVLDRSLKPVITTVSLMVEKVDLLYGKAAVGVSNA